MARGQQQRGEEAEEEQREEEAEEEREEEREEVEREEVEQVEREEVAWRLRCLEAGSCLRQRGRGRQCTAGARLAGKLGRRGEGNTA